MARLVERGCEVGSVLLGLGQKKAPGLGSGAKCITSQQQPGIPGMAILASRRALGLKMIIIAAHNAISKSVRYRTQWHVNYTES